MGHGSRRLYRRQSFWAASTCSRSSGRWRLLSSSRAPQAALQAASLHLLAIASKLDGMVRISTDKIAGQIGSLGEFIAGQRRAAQLSLRQLAEQTGISNPYLSQIERGLRKPSAEVLQQLAKALRVSAETLYVRAGILDPDDHHATSVEMAVLADIAITERQKRVLIDVYASFVKENSKNATTMRKPGPHRAQIQLSPNSTE